MGQPSHASILLTEYSSTEVKDEFYLHLSLLIQSMFSPDILLVAADFNTKVRYSKETEGYIKGPFSVSADHNENDDCLRLFQANTDLCYKVRH